MNSNSYYEQSQFAREVEEPEPDSQRKISKAVLSKTIFYRDVHRYISRYWKFHIGPAEYLVLDMVFDRTIGWGKLWECIPLNHFVYGMWNGEDVYTDGTGMGKRTVQRAIETLCSNKVIRKRGTKGEAASFAVNLLWKPPALAHLGLNTPECSTGAQRYWQDVAARESRKIYELIQLGGEGLYDCHFKKGRRD